MNSLERAGEKFSYLFQRLRFNAAWKVVEGWAMRRGAKLKKTNRMVKPSGRGGLQLPKFIRDNIQHPLLRLGWWAELEGSQAKLRGTGSVY